MSLQSGGAVLTGLALVLLAGVCVAEEQAQLARALAAASCAASPVVTAPFVEVERTPIERGGALLGERLRLVANGRLAFRVERLAPDGVLRRVLVEVSSITGHEQRAELQLLFGADCVLRGGRRLLRRADGSVEALQLLDAHLAPVMPPQPLDAEPPPGIDPGGIAVAMVDSGVNYLIDSIASRLARDPDGAPLGYDWWDMDPRPFDAHAAASPFFVQRHGTRTASLMLAEAPVARLVPYRYPRPDMARMAALIEHADRNGVLIVNLSLGGNKREEWQVFEAAAAARPQVLFIASAGNNGRDIDTEPVYPAVLSLPNLVVVTSSNDDGTLAPGSNWGARSVHLLLPAEYQLATGFDGHARLVSGSSYAAARLSALAACLLAANPQWRAPELRAALFAHAVTPPQAGLVAVGLLPDPVTLERGACAAEAREPAQADTYDLWLPRAAMQTPRARMKLSVMLLRETGWRAEDLPPALAETARLLGQCGIVLEQARVREIVATRRLRQFSSRYSAALMPLAPPTRPVVFLVADTLEPEPFEAEAIGRRNAGRRRALVDTVWLTRALSRPGLAMAHELAHLLADSGAHHDDPANLMSESSARSAGRLQPAQCEAMLQRGLATGLLTPLQE